MLRSSFRYLPKSQYYSSLTSQHLSRKRSINSTAASNMKTWTVDSFTTTPFKGNPAGVVAIIDDNDDIFTNDRKCLQISSEINLSETAFIRPLKYNNETNNRYQIRWFTPKVEVDLCGHATLAAAHIICTENPFGRITTANTTNKRELIFDSVKSGITLSVKQELSTEGVNNKYTLDFPIQSMSDEILEIDDVVLDVFDNDKNVTIKNIAKPINNDATIIEINDITYLKNKVFDSNKIMTKISTRGLIITTAAAEENDKYDFYSRYFAPKSGIMEDPVTGSAHCKLADYWSKKLGKVKFKAYQASSRGGELDLEIVNGDRVHITGSAVTMFHINTCCY